jgi:hypothetical protein
MKIKIVDYATPVSVSCHIADSDLFIVTGVENFIIFSQFQ